MESQALAWSHLFWPLTSSFHFWTWTKATCKGCWMKLWHWALKVVSKESRLQGFLHPWLILLKLNHGLSCLQILIAVLDCHFQILLFLWTPAATTCHGSLWVLYPSLWLSPGIWPFLDTVTLEVHTLPVLWRPYLFHSLSICCPGQPLPDPASSLSVRATLCLEIPPLANVPL